MHEAIMDTSKRKIWVKRARNTRRNISECEESIFPTILLHEIGGQMGDNIRVKDWGEIF
jgi:hypothetical protein